MTRSSIPTPSLMYGTAWKEEQTTALVSLALAAGFRAIDTANQRKHYVEEGVGAAIADAKVPRDELFLQSKFTYVRGQDHRLPYDLGKRLSVQVLQSFESSLKHLATDYLDSYLLHGPSDPRKWSDSDREVWRTMEGLHRDGRVKAIGVSNIDNPSLETLLAEAEIKPAYVQNRCYAISGWDRSCREICRERGLVYQGFSLLTANRDAIAHHKLREIAQRNGATIPQLVFRYSQQVGMLPLTGTTNPEHMAQDLACEDFSLSEEELLLIENIAMPN